ncbi:2'-(5''-triphosphoribosyl)-3'-dephospho-CoA:apo-citrate lyase [Edwardsiella tarda]|nr:2'-(5''-triphosphoribosyl)-3'-dephospho-CoA:apo-citrate lyase [Edwardsiella tarda]
MQAVSADGMAGTPYLYADLLHRGRPGPVKDSPLTRRLFNAGIGALNQLAQRQAWTIREQLSLDLATGPEGLMAIAAPADVVKRATIDLEQTHTLAGYGISMSWPPPDKFCRVAIISCPYAAA